jgi:hypothetical protein
MGTVAFELSAKVGKQGPSLPEEPGRSENISSLRCKSPNPKAETLSSKNIIKANHLKTSKLSTVTSNLLRYLPSLTQQHQQQKKV